MKNFVISIILFFAVSLSLRGQELSVAANLLDCANFGTLNISASWGFSRHFSADATVKYNPFEFGQEGEGLRNKQRSVSAGARWWPWHIFSGWWVSGALRYQEYNTGGGEALVTSEGDRYGAGVGLGYTYMLAPWLNLDVGLGVWAGCDTYVSYACPTCGRTVAAGSKYFIKPSDFILSIAYIF